MTAPHLSVDHPRGLRPVEFLGFALSGGDARPRTTRLPGASLCIGGLLLAALSVMTAGCAADPGSIAQSFVEKLAARDASAGALLTQPSALLGIASTLGIAGLPASVTVTASSVVAVKAQSATDPTTVTAVFEAKRGDETLGRGSASFSLAIVDTSAGPRIDAASSSATGGLGVLATLDPQTPGTSQDDAQAAFDDYAAGNAWLPGVQVNLRQSTDPIIAEPIVSTDPTRLSSYHATVSGGVPGVRTTWYVDVYGGTGLAALSHVVASDITQQPVAERDVVGLLDPAEVTGAAHQAAAKFTDAIALGDIQTASDLLVDAAAVPITEAGWALMKNPSWAPKIAPAASGVQLAGDAVPLRAQDGDLALLRAADGSWRIDAMASNLITDLRSGTGTYKYVNDQPLIGYGGDTVVVTLKSVLFRHSAGGDSAVAYFTFKSLTPCSSWGCDMYATDGLRAVHVSWTGNAGGYDVPASQLAGQTALGQEMTGTVSFDGPTPADAPIEILVTAFGNADVGSGWRFSTR